MHISFLTKDDTALMHVWLILSYDQHPASLAQCKHGLYRQVLSSYIPRKTAVLS